MTLLEIPPLPAELSALEPTRSHAFPPDDPSAVSDAKREYWVKWKETHAPKPRERKVPAVAPD